MVNNKKDEETLKELREITKVKENWGEMLDDVADHDTHPVVRIHSAGAIRITRKALEEIENAADN